jgi:RNA-directed DNA polymerase
LLAKVMLDALDKELERRGLRVARYADDFLIFVRAQRAATRVLHSINRFIEGYLRLRVNPNKRKAARLSACPVLGFELSRAKWPWSDAAVQRVKARVREITNRSHGRHRTARLEALQRDVSGWLIYFGHSQSYAEMIELDQWLRRRVRRCDWQQWQRPRTRRRPLLALGITRDEVKLATRSRTGPWRMADHRLVQRALNTPWLWMQGVPHLRHQWIDLHDGASAP